MRNFLLVALAAVAPLFLLSSQASAVELANCTPQNQAAVLADIKRNGLGLYLGRYYRFRGTDVPCLEKAGVLVTTNRAVASTDESYAQVYAKLVKFDANLTDEELSLSLKNFISRFLVKKRRATVLSAKVVHGGETVQETPLLGVHFGESGGRRATVMAYAQGPLSPWMPLTAADSVTYSLKGYETKEVDFTFISTIVGALQRAASFQTSPTKFLSAMTRPAVVAAAKEIETKLSANNNRRVDIDAPITLDFLGPDADEAGVFFELNDKTGRPAAAILIFTRYRQSMLTDRGNSSVPVFDNPEPTVMITTNALGPLGAAPAQSNPLDFMRTSNPTILEGLGNRNLDAFNSACSNLSSLLTSRADLKKFDHAAMMWGFLHWEKSAWSIPEVRRGSICPNPFLLGIMKMTLGLPTFDIAAGGAPRPVTDADVALAAAAIVQSMKILQSNLAPNIRRDTAIDVLKPRLPEFVVDDPQGVSGSEIDKELKTARNAVTQVLEKIAATFDDIGCSTSARAIMSRDAEQRESAPPKAGYILLATSPQAATQRYASMQLDFGATTASKPAIALKRLSDAEAVAARAAYGCNNESFPLFFDLEVARTVE